jgi:MFS family permease
MLFATRVLRLFAFGMISVVLVLYLSAAGLDARRIGLLISATLAGDIVVSLVVTTRADRLGRRAMLRLGAILMAATGCCLATAHSFPILLIAAAAGILSPSGNEIGPFLAIEQAALSEVSPPERRTSIFAWYHLAGSIATALGALAGGSASSLLRSSGFSDIASYRTVVWAYAALGAALLLPFAFVTTGVEATAGGDGPRPGMLGLRRSRGIVMRLSALFALDAFAGGFVVQSIMVYWFHIRFGVSAWTLGSIFFGANLLAGGSALVAAPMARRFGLINTMVFTHIPSNLLLMLVPLMPSLPLAVAVLLLRFSISQMDVPTRQSYTMAVVESEERSAASGITAVARSVGAAASPSLAGLILATPGLLAVPFLVSGGLKIVYDLLLYRGFRAHAPPEREGA